MVLGWRNQWLTVVTGTHGSRFGRQKVNMSQGRHVSPLVDVCKLLASPSKMQCSVVGRARECMAGTSSVTK